MELSLILFRVDGAREITSWEGFAECRLRSFTAAEARAALLPLLPPGTDWPEGSEQARWRNEHTPRNCFELSAEGSNIGLFGGPLDDPSIEASLRRIDASGEWLMVDPATGRVIHFHPPD